MSASFSVSWVGGDYQYRDSSKEEELIDIRREDFILEVPFEEKDDAKSFGCRWDKDSKKWFVPKGMDLNIFKKWHPKPSSSSGHLSSVHEQQATTVVNRNVESVEGREESLSKETTKIDMNFGFSSSDDDDEESEKRKHNDNPSPAFSTLTDEQRLRIEQNRLQAMEKRRLKSLKEDQLQQEHSTKEITEVGKHIKTPTSSYLEEKANDNRDVIVAFDCIDDPDVCRTCNERPADVIFKDAFNVLVCNACKAKHDDFKLHNKVEIKEIYLLTDSTIRLMKCLMKDNPHNPHWAQMKLYLAKHGQEKSIERWGSEAALEEERNRRKKEQYNKDLAKASKVLLTSAVPNAGIEVDEVEDNTTGHLSRMLQMMKDDSTNELDALHGGNGLGERIIEACHSEKGEEAAIEGKKKDDRKKKGPTSTQSDPKKAKKLNRMAAIMTGNY